MSDYMKKFDQELREKLNGKVSDDEFVRWVCERMLASFRNGIKAGQNGAQVIRSGESRSRGSFGKKAE